MECIEVKIASPSFVGVAMTVKVSWVGYGIAICQFMSNVIARSPAWRDEEAIFKNHSVII
jgi:hypothetical protein